MLLDSYGAGNTFYLTIFTWQNAGTNTSSYNWQPVYGGRLEGEILGKSGLTQKAAQGISRHGPKDSDLLGVPLRDVQGQLVAGGQLGRTLGPQNHQRHVFQIWRGRALSGLLMIVDKSWLICISSLSMRKWNIKFVLPVPVYSLIIDLALRLSQKTCNWKVASLIPGFDPRLRSPDCWGSHEREA